MRSIVKQHPHKSPHSLAELEHCREPCGLHVYEKFGSSGRIRTYNPSVNSRMACSRLTLQTQGLTSCKSSFSGNLGGLWGYSRRRCPRQGQWFTAVTVLWGSPAPEWRTGHRSPDGCYCRAPPKPPRRQLRQMPNPLPLAMMKLHSEPSRAASPALNVTGVNLFSVTPKVPATGVA